MYMPDTVPITGSAVWTILFPCCPEPRPHLVTNGRRCFPETDCIQLAHCRSNWLTEKAAQCSREFIVNTRSVLPQGVVCIILGLYHCPSRLGANASDLHVVTTCKHTSEDDLIASNAIQVQSSQDTVLNIKISKLEQRISINCQQLSERHQEELALTWMEDETTHLKNGNVGVAAVEDSKVHFTCSKQMSKLDTHLHMATT